MQKARFALSIVQVPIVALRPNPRNARTHSERQIAQMEASIERFGFINPIIADHHNVVWVGNGRLEAGKRRGFKTVPVIYLEHMSPAELRAYAIADNRLAEKSGWDNEVLALEFQELAALAPDLDITLTGFEIGEIDLIIGEAASDGKTAEEQAQESVPDGPAVCQLGDVWHLGDHRILCQDTLAVGSFARLLDSAQADVVFTDPPYNVPITGHATGKGRIQYREFAMASGEMSDTEFRGFLQQVTNLLSAHAKPGSIHYLCMDWRHVLGLLDIGQRYYELKNICVWVKDNGGMGSLYRSQHELVVVFKKPGSEHQNNIQLGRFGRNRTNVWSYPGANSFSRKGEEGDLLALHPTVKPVAMVADAILDCSAPRDIVLDCFLGSGSTLIAAEKTRRRCYGIELDAAYVDTAIRRWQRLTGQQAIHADTGLKFDDFGARNDG